MGIQDFYNVIKDECPEQLVSKKISEMPKGYRIAVDISVFLYKFVRSAGPKMWINTFIILICLLKKYYLKAVCIFDGPNPPIEKRNEQLARRESTAKIQDKMKRCREVAEVLKKKVTYIPSDEELVEIKFLIGKKELEDNTNYSSVKDIIFSLLAASDRYEKQSISIGPEYKQKAIEIISALGVAYMEADGEAEGLCASLCVHGMVDAVLTEDTDVMAYGTPQMWGKLDIERETVQVMYSHSIHSAMGMTYPMFRDMCILLECDYNKRLHGIGYKKIPDLIREHKTIENVLTDPIVVKAMAREKNPADPELLLINRCREIFTVLNIQDFEFIVPYNKPIDQYQVAKFLAENNSVVSIDYILGLFTQKVIIEFETK